MKNNFKKFFSIITPVKDGSKFIDRYLTSLKSQTFKDWEAIIIDDGSKDMSLNILKSRTSDDDRFIVVENLQTKTLNSPYFARNIGLEKASGKYICFLDIDDMWLPNKLMRQYEIISKGKDYKLIFSEYYRYLEGVDILIKRKPIKFIKIKFLIDFLNPVPMLSSCVKADVIEEIRFKPQFHEDYIFWKEIISKIPEGSIFSDKIPNSVYFVSNKSLSANKVKAVSWLLKIYFLDNKNYFLIAFKLFIRALFQIYIYISDKKVNKQIVENHSMYF